jgi:hypothetical protein
MMVELPNFHDGFFDGICISEKTAYLFLRTYLGERSTILLKEVERMNLSNFRAGNIIFDVVLVDARALTTEQIKQLYELSDAGKAEQLLKKAQEQSLNVIEINPSYGAECTGLFRTAEILTGYVLPPESVPPSA